MSAAFPTLPAVLADRAVTPDDGRYRFLRSSYTRPGSPAVVLLPQTDDEVAAAIRYAAGSGLPVSVRSGGHGIPGRSTNDGGVIVDLSSMKAIELTDAERRLVRVQAGARWAEVAAELAPHGLAITSGDHGNVGVGGLATAGGIGFLARRDGLTIDRVRAATVVLVDGTIHRVDDEHEPDLFWAIRGAGDRVGIVTEFEFEAASLPGVGVARIALLVDESGDTLRRWSDHVSAAPRELTTNGLLGGADGSGVLQLTAVVADNDPDRVLELVQPLTELGPLLEVTAHITPYSGLVSTAQLHPNFGTQRSTVTNGYLPALDARSARALAATAFGPHAPLVQFRASGGAVNDVAPDATAFPHRHQQLHALFATFPPAGERELAQATRDIRPFLDGAYRNFQSDPDAEFDLTFPGETGVRVRELQRRYDPDGVLTRWAQREGVAA